jgi:hypothetical protein
MYLWALRILLERISWWIRDHGNGTSVVTFAHITNFRTHKLHNYRSALAMSPTNIHWPSFAGNQFHFAGMASVRLLQLAVDCLATSIMTTAWFSAKPTASRSMQTTFGGATSERC